MGIPKFFRYISERYPMTSQLIEEDKIPEFDNLYLDFNGIIHNCSHPNDDDAHFRMSEEQIFTSIFSYVDMLFSKIKPKKLFFMAVDGVAPRAKMNQQRSRRFRTAKEAKELREKAIRNGEKLPDEKAFDSNCITPGTLFMARLSEQLKYFVNKKVTEDADWQGVEIVLSGHDVPGEGEHKIMEYIRLSKAQPDYNPNMRHCLYGLDADLIMLGLLSHDPHFCLLREEVKFGPARKKTNKGLGALNFYLLHLSLMREYLNLEFSDIEATLPFEYSLERIIDDFILLAVFVGNDFLPNLPDLHIHENGLERLFEVYKNALPGLGGYINDAGAINVKRLQVILDEMALWEREVFEKEYADLNWYKGKQEKYVREMETARKRNKLVLTRPQQIIFNEVKQFVLSHRGKKSGHQSDGSDDDEDGSLLSMPNTFPARERTFIAKLAEDLNLNISWDEYDEDQNLVVWRFPSSTETRADEEESSEDEEALAAVDRVLQKYEKAKVAEDDDDDDFDERHERGIQQKMDEWKRGYYREKLEISFNNPKDMGDLTYRYVEGLQWVMFYYYRGVASWGWFYNYHYAPRISDLKGVDKMTFHFDLGTPFRPFEQLMGVLPEASKELIPPAYRELMTDVSSPILDFYPREFEQDLNGKKAEWEAIVKIPFIDEKRLLGAMSTKEHMLTSEERGRNSFGNSIKFSYDPQNTKFYPSSLEGFFPALPRCTCKMETFYLPVLDGLHLVPGLCDGVLLGIDALAGFPSLQSLPHTAQLGYHGVNVHGSESKNKSMVVHIQNRLDGVKTEKIAQDMVGKRTFVNWPFVREAMVVAVSDHLFKFEKVAFGDGKSKRVLSNPHSQQGLMQWKARAEKIEQQYSKRLGVITGPIEVMLHVRPLKGLRRLDTGAFVKDYEGPDKEFEQAVQLVLPEVISEDPRFMEQDPPPLNEEFPADTKVFFLGDHAYGVAGQVQETTETTISVKLAFFPNEKVENDRFTNVVRNRVPTRYYPSFKVAGMIGLSGHALSKVTASFMVLTSDGQKHNLGLSLKFEAKSLKVVGYSRKMDRYWEFSDKAVDLLREYKAKYPELFAGIVGNRSNQMAEARDMFPNAERPDAKVKEIRQWLKSMGVLDLEAVSLFCDQLDQGTVSEIVQLADNLRETKTENSLKKAIVNGIPRQALLKPAHALYRLHTQRFSLGDRVIMVKDSGSIPLAIKGVVVGINNKSMDVVWDVPLMAGTTLGDRCPQYRGSTVEFNSCLNLSRPQCIISTHPNTPAKPINTGPVYNPRIGPVEPAYKLPAGQSYSTTLKPATTLRGGGSAPKRILTNPNRGRGGSPQPNGANAWNKNANVNSGSIVDPPDDLRTEILAIGPLIVQQQNNHPRGRGRGGNQVPSGSRGRGGGFITDFNNNFNTAYRGRGGFYNGRGYNGRGGFRGRGRGSPAPRVSSGATSS